MEEDVALSPFNNRENTYMQWVLWAIYLSGIASFFGWIVMLPLGIGTYYIWLPIEAIIDLITVFEGKAEFTVWLIGPFLKTWITGPIFFHLAVFFSMYPIVNVLMCIILGWLAVMDYYSWEYVLFEGPQDPNA